MKKIVLVHLFNDRSGSPKVLSQVAHILDKKGFQLDVLTSSHKDGFLSDVPGRRINIFYGRTDNKLVTLLLYLISQVHLFFLCLRYMGKDVVFYVNTMMPSGAAIAALIMRKEVIYHIHETSIRPALLKKILRLVIRVAADKVIFVSKYLEGVEGFSKKNQIVIPNAIEWDGGVGRVGKNEIFNVLMVCSLKEYKGVPEYFQVAKILSARRDMSFTLVLNADREDVDRMLFDGAVPSNVRCIPRQNCVKDFYQEADLLISMSRPDQWIETFGLTILEGMCYGLPVIAPPVGGPAEIVRDGRDGYLISCYETQRIAEVICKLMCDKELYFRLSESARLRASEFSLDNFEEKLIDFIGS